MDTTDGACAQRDLVTTAAFLAGFLVLGLILALAAGTKSPALVVLWCLGCTAGGFVVGFLFGFPRLSTEPHDTTGGSAGGTVVQAPAGPTPAGRLAHRLAINTNLEQVSDWLTKIIVGVGLVELKNVPSVIARAGRYFGAGFGGGADVREWNERLAAVILVFFVALGMLAGYLLTRMFFSAAFRRADLDTIGERQARELAQTPLDKDGKKVELSAATKQAASKLAAAAPQELADASSDTLAARARALFDLDEYQNAVKVYEAALRRSPRDARLRYSYAIALRYAGRSEREYMPELEQARRLARTTPDLELRREIYTAYTYYALYLDPPEGFNSTREAAIEYRDNPENLPSGDVLFNLACAYGQEYNYEKGREAAPEVLASLRANALDNLKRALAVDRELKGRAQQLLEGRSPGDDDLLAFREDQQFRAAVGLT